MEGSGFLLNLSEDLPKKVKIVEEKRPEKGISSTSPEASVTKKITNSVKSASAQRFKFKKKHDKASVGASNAEHVQSSSIFISNPEIPSLSVCQRKGVSEPLFSTETLENLNLHPHLVACLKQRLEVTKLTYVQEKTIPVLLDCKDALVKSCTGSGKTLAYAVPIVQKLQEMSPKIRRIDGIFALVIVPTRELALQCFECFSTLTKSFTWVVPGYLIGGEKKKSEKARLRKGINILICTPGRLLDHLDSTACLALDKINWLIIDEADRLLEEGFEDSVHRIISKCQTSRQTVLLSATLSKGVERLAGMSLNIPVQIDAASIAGKHSEEFQEFSLPDGLKQAIVVVPSKLRLTVMSAFIIDNYLRGLCKGLVFLFSQSNVDFHYSLLSGVLAPLLKGKGQKCKFFRLQGSMKQEERTEIYNSFKSTKQGILLCTDVAARGLDLPHVDWILQYSAPQSAEMYIHRVGRTARIGQQGSALLFLLPSETKFSKLLSLKKIQYDEVEASKIIKSLMLIGNLLTFKDRVSAEDCATALHTRYEKEVYAEEKLHECAREAFASYVQSYASYPKDLKEILPFKALHLGHVAKSFCMREAPSDLNHGLPQTQHFQKPFRRGKDKRIPIKRKLAAVSEFDSGLSFLKKRQVGGKRRKN